MASFSESKAHLRSSSITRISAAQSYTLVLQQDASTGEAVGSSSAAADAAATAAVYMKVSIRLLPLFMTMLVLNWLDRSCLAFASIQMTQELHFTPEVYGLASGFFFLPYCLLQVPANYVCMALGVQRWFTCIQIMFGLTAASFAAVRHPWQLFLLRLLLGVAEAGSFPGVWYAISLWFPPDRIAFPYSLMATSVAVSQTIAAPIAAALLQMDGLLGLSGWQWVFIGEGIPSVLLGMCLPWLLPDGPHALDATVSSWLAPHEVQLLQADHAAKVSDFRSPSSHDTSCHAAKEGAGHPDSAMPHKLQLLIHVVRVWQVWYLAFCNILKDVGNLGLMMWLPVMVQSLLSGADPMQLAGSSSSSSSSEGGASPSSTGVSAVLLSAIPFTSAALAVTFFGHHAQRTGTPPLWYFISFCWIGGVALVAFHWVVEWSRVLGFCCLILTLSCAFAASPHPPTVVAKLTTGPAAAIALPLYNSVAMLGGFFGPALMGWFVQHLGGFGAATAVLGASMVASGCFAWLLQHIMLRDVHTRAIAAGRAHGIGAAGSGCSTAGAAVDDSCTGKAAGGLAAVAVGSGEVADGYEVVYRRSSSSIKRKGAPRGTAAAADCELARLVQQQQHQASEAAAAAEL